MQNKMYNAFFYNWYDKMPSVFEKFGIKEQDDYTPIPELRINSYLSAMQIESQTYFTLPKRAQAADQNKLAVTVKEGQHFHTTNASHTDFLNRCTALFQEKSEQLKSIDRKIIGSVAFAITASALSFLPVVGFLGWIGWAAIIYYINERARAYAEYHEALTLLVGACNWSLGEGPEERQDYIPDLIKNDSIHNMMAELYPVLTDAQVRHLIADDTEGEFTKKLKDYEEKYRLCFNPHTLFAKKEDDETDAETKKAEAIALSKKGAEFNRCIYGLNRGGFTDFLDAIVSILPDLYNAAVHGFQRLKYKWQENTYTPPAPPTETAQENLSSSALKC